MMIIARINPTGNRKLKVAFIRKAKNLAPTALQFRIITRRIHGWIQKFSEAGFSVNLFLQLISFFKLLNLVKKIVLVIDNAPSHPDEKELSSGDTRVIFLPPNST
jgi:hypothetical protein